MSTKVYNYRLISVNGPRKIKIVSFLDMLCILKNKRVLITTKFDKLVDHYLL